MFTGYLYETLQLWGIGRRASRLVPIKHFRHCLQASEQELAALDHLRIEDDLLDTADVSTKIDKLIRRLGVVDNKSLIVAGTKTLHHVLPDLVPPMDRRWTGAFYGWWPMDPQQRQTTIFTTAFQSFAEIARCGKPSRLVGVGWRTSASKLLDNAIVSYCMANGVTPRGLAQQHSNPWRSLTLPVRTPAAEVSPEATSAGISGRGALCVVEVAPEESRHSVEGVTET